MSNSPVSVPYNVVSLAILELLMMAYAVDTALFLAVRSACFAVRVMIFNSVSFGAYLVSECITAMMTAKC